VVYYLLPEGFFVLDHGHLHDLHVALPHELPVHHHPRSYSRSISVLARSSFAISIDPDDQISLAELALELEHTKLLEEREQDEQVLWWF
jgi:hypothetical protein